VRRPIGKGSRTVTFVVKKYVPEKQGFDESTCEVQADPFTSVLDALIGIKERSDRSLSMRYSCNMGICGSCGMVINGKPRLACETNVFSLGSSTITVGPMEAHPMVKDLVTDFDEFFSKHQSVKPWLVREDRVEQFEARREYRQTRNQVDFFLDFAHCIKCGLCVDACPVSNTNPHFVGPQALGQAYRYNSDSRDQGEKDRLDDLDRLDGIWGCEFAGACSEVCPKGVDPALTIQQMKIDLMKRRLLGRGSGEKRAR